MPKRTSLLLAKPTYLIIFFHPQGQAQNRGPDLGAAPGRARAEAYFSASSQTNILSHLLPIRRGKPKIVDLTSERRLAERVSEAYVACGEAQRDEVLYCLLAKHPGVVHGNLFGLKLCNKGSGLIVYCLAQHLVCCCACWNGGRPATLCAPPCCRPHHCVL